MAELTIDARSLPCPQPVILARSAIIAGETPTITVIVDDPAQAENVADLARNQGWAAQVAKVDGDDIYVLLSRVEGETADITGVACGVPTRITVLVASEKFGQGADELGGILMRAFLKTVREVLPRPQKVIFLNSGVKLTVEGAELLPDIKLLEADGMQILSCGTCLDYYKIKDKLAVGKVSNMFDIATALVSSDRVVRL
jgi:selenium metabolism protein YedF